MKITLLFLLLFCANGWALEPVSGYQYLSPEARAMQDDEFENPGMVAVDEGRRLFNEMREDEEYACASCHESNGVGLDRKKIAAYPQYDENRGGLVTLQDQVGYCWEIKMDRFPESYDAPELVALETFVRNKANGIAVNVKVSPGMDALLKEGEQLFNTRFGQLDMSCAHCHVQHQGQYLRGQVLTQGHTNGFPEYRLEKGRITSLHKRLRECFISFRAEPFDPGSEEFKLLELYTAYRGNGLEIETPAVRN